MTTRHQHSQDPANCQDSAPESQRSDVWAQSEDPSSTGLFTAGIRYGCMESREDAELAVTDRLYPAALANYHQHLRGCASCRRVHQLLLAVYSGPEANASGLGTIAKDREFSAILRRRHEFARPVPVHHHALQFGGVAVLAGTAVVLFAALLSGPSANNHDDPRTRSYAEAQAREAGRAGDLANDEVPDPSRHQAQVDYGRVIAGRGYLSTRGDGPPVLTDTFTVGTRFSADAAQSLQVSLFGRILANFEPSTEIEWTHASPVALDLTLERGYIAVRYDRDASDPVLNIHTPSALVRVVGTVFTVEVDNEGSTNVAVLRGKVEVLNPEDHAFVASVPAGYRFELGRGTITDVSRQEVQVAMPLSDEASSLSASAEATVPSNWVVPGLPSSPSLRRLEDVLTRAPQPERPREHRPATRTVRRYPQLRATAKADDGQALLDTLVRDVAERHRETSRAALERCKMLYQAANTRYLAARCLMGFVEEHGDDDDLVEAHLLVGILRMDFAGDYPAAKLAFERFLERAPTHPEAELARYRLWLAGIERGAVQEAIQRGREYLHRYPNGKYAGKILQRFPKLVSEL